MPGGQSTPAKTTTKDATLTGQFEAQLASFEISKRSSELIRIGAGLATPATIQEKLPWKFSDLILRPLAKVFPKWGFQLAKRGFGSVKWQQTVFSKAFVAGLFGLDDLNIISKMTSDGCLDAANRLAAKNHPNFLRFLGACASHDITLFAGAIKKILEYQPSQFESDKTCLAALRPETRLLIAAIVVTSGESKHLSLIPELISAEPAEQIFLANIAHQKDPLLAISIVRYLPLLPDTLTNSIFRNALILNPWALKSAGYELQKYGISPEELSNQCACTDPARFVNETNKPWELRDNGNEAVNKYFIVAALTDPFSLIDHFEENPCISQETRTTTARLMLKSDRDNFLKYFFRVGIDSNDTNFEFVNELLTPDFPKITEVLGIFKLTPEQLAITWKKIAAIHPWQYIDSGRAVSDDGLTLAEISDRCAKSNPGLFLSRISEQWQLGVEGVESLNEHILKTADRNPFKALVLIESWQDCSQQIRCEVATIYLQKDIPGLIAAFPRLGLSDSEKCLEVAIGLAPKGAAQLIPNLSLFNLDSTQRQTVWHELVSKDPWAVSDSKQDLSSFGISKELIAERCAIADPQRFIKESAQTQGLGVEGAAAIDKHVLNAAKKNPFQALSLLTNDLVSQDARAKIAEQMLQKDPAELATHFAELGIKSEILRFSFAQAIVQVKPATLTHFLKGFELEVEHRRTILNEVAQRAAIKAAKFIENFDLPDYEAEKLFFDTVFQKTPSKIPELLRELKVKNDELVLSWARRYSEAKPATFRKDFSAFSVSTEEATSQMYDILRGTGYVPKLRDLGNQSGIPEEVVCEVLKSALTASPWKVLKEIAVRGISNKELVEQTLDEVWERDPKKAVREMERCLSHLPEEMHDSVVLKCMGYAGADIDAQIRLCEAFPGCGKETKVAVIERTFTTCSWRAEEVSRELGLWSEDMALRCYVADAIREPSLAIIESIYFNSQLKERARSEIAQALARKSPALVLESMNSLGLYDENLRLPVALAVVETLKSKWQRKAELVTKVCAGCGIFSPEAVLNLAQKAGMENAGQILEDKDSSDKLAQKIHAKIRAEQFTPEFATLILSLQRQSPETFGRIKKEIIASYPSIALNFALLLQLTEEEKARLIHQGANKKSYPKALFQNGIYDQKLYTPVLLSMAGQKIDKILNSERLSGVLDLPESAAVFFVKASENYNLELMRQVVEARARRQGKAATLQVRREGYLALIKSSLLLDTSSEVKGVFKSLERVCKSGAEPTKTLLTAFNHFDDDADNFLCQVVGTAGPSFGDNIISVLLSTVQKRIHIEEEEKAVISLFIGSGFRGFSKATFDLAINSYRKSPGHCETLLKQWGDISSKILKGSPLTDTELSNPLLPEMIYAAYQPVGLDVNQVRRKLDEIQDYSNHLQPWEIRPEGYLLDLSKSVAITLKAGAELNREAINELCKKFIAADKSKTKLADLQLLIVKASQRASNDMDKLIALSALCGSSTDTRWIELINNLETFLQEESITPTQAYETLQELEEFFSVVAVDMIQEILPQRITSGEIQDDEALRTRVARGLNVPIDQINPEAIEQFLKKELSKTFLAESQLISKEQKKFSNHSKTTRGEIRAYVVKNKAAYFGRAGAGLCSWDDGWSWKNPDFLQMNLIDHKNEKVVGNIQLHIFTNKNGKRSVLARPNPTQQFCTKSDLYSLAEGMIDIIQQFAKDNNLIPYIPDQDGYQHLLTNRVQFASFLMRFAGTKISHQLKLTASLTSSAMYLLNESE